MAAAAAARLATHAREWVSVLRQPSREKQLCAAFRERDSRALRSRVSREARMLWERQDSLVTVRPSTIPGAGAGLFVLEATGPARTGTGLALYTGAYFRNAEAWAALGEADAEPDASYVLNLSTHDGAPTGCIDARSVSEAEPRLCAHLINHPPPGQPANVAPAAFRWTDAYDGERQVHGPAARVGALVVALEDICPGRELFLDYRLRSRASLVDALTNKREWSERYPPWFSVAAAAP